MANKAALVDQVKSLQRSDPEVKQAWWDLCEKHLGGIKDPNRHDADVLSEFLEQYADLEVDGRGGGGASGRRSTRAASSPRVPAANPGARLPARGDRSWAPPARAYGVGYAAPAYPPAYALHALQAYGSPQVAPVGSGPKAITLQEFVKFGQRKSSHWKDAWQRYCGMYGSGLNDPNKYEEAFIVGFIDYVGQLGKEDLAILAEEQGIVPDSPENSGTKRRLANPSQGPPAKAKKSAGGGGGGKGFAGYPDAPDEDNPEKQALVDRVKDLQRSNPDAKTAWWAFCDDSNNGVKDPRKHTAEQLNQFLADYE